MTAQITRIAVSMRTLLFGLYLLLFLPKDRILFNRAFARSSKYDLDRKKNKFYNGTKFFSQQSLFFCRKADAVGIKQSGQLLCLELYASQRAGEKRKKDEFYI